MIYWKIFVAFFQTGLFAVGGGLATLPFFYAMTETTNWFTSNDIADMIAIAQSTPGPLGVNISTYAGYHIISPWGGLVATLSLTLPSLLCILIIHKIFKNNKNSNTLNNIFYGLNPASCALIAAAGIGVAKTTWLNLSFFKETGNFINILNIKTIIIAIIVWITLRKLKKHPIWYIIFSAIAGILLNINYFSIS